MGHTTVRVKEQTREMLRSLSETEGRSMQAVLEAALESYRRQRFLERVNAGYARLRRDEKSWAQVLEDRAAWDAVLGDGLTGESAEYQDVEVHRRRVRRKGR